MSLLCTYHAPILHQSPPTLCPLPTLLKLAVSNLCKASTGVLQYAWHGTSLRVSSSIDWCEIEADGDRMRRRRINGGPQYLAGVPRFSPWPVCNQLFRAMRSLVPFSTAFHRPAIGRLGAHRRVGAVEVWCLHLAKVWVISLSISRRTSIGSSPGFKSSTTASSTVSSRLRRQPSSVQSPQPSSS